MQNLKFQAIREFESRRRNSESELDNFAFNLKVTLSSPLSLIPVHNECYITKSQLPLNTKI